MPTREFRFGDFDEAIPIWSRYIMLGRQSFDVDDRLYSLENIMVVNFASDTFFLYMVYLQSYMLVDNCYYILAIMHTEDVMSTK